MVPKYPFRVDVATKTGSGVLDRRTKNFEHLQAAMDYRNKCIGRQGVSSITVLMVLDQTGPATRED